MFDPEESAAERSLRGRMAVQKSWANTADRQKRTRPGRAKFEARFEAQVDPDGKLSPAERRQRAAAARAAYFAELALKSARARRLRNTEVKA